MNDFLKKIKSKRWEIFFLVVVIATGIFLRTFHFSQWLHFEIDQAYDANRISPAVEGGIGNLPLLGPNVGGGSLRLGPAFYYMEYASARIFGDLPQGHAANVLVFSILALPLFYIFCKRYFSTYESLGLLAIFSTSLFNVLYSRFSWSPNVLPFLILFSFYALLRSVSTKEKYPARWFLVAVAAVTITSQIHFNSFFTVPLIAVLFTIIKHPGFNWKVWLSAFAIILFIYSPVVLNDIKANGQNLQYFKTKLLKTSALIASPTKIISQDIAYNAYEYFFISTANDQINGFKLNGYGFTCDSCQENLPVKILAIIIFLSALLLLAWNIIKEKDRERKNFLLLIVLWFLVSFYLFYTIARAYRMYPRFFLLVSPLAIIFYGFVLQYIKPELNKKRLALFSAIILVFVTLNIQKIIPVFKQLQSVPVSANQDIENGDIFPNTNRLTLEEETKVVDYIETKYKENGYPVYINIKMNYDPAFWFLLEKRGIHYYDDLGGDDQIYAQGNYFDIKFSDGRQSIDSRFAVKDKMDLGTLTVYDIVPLSSSITAIRQPYSQRKILQEDTSSIIYTWKQLFE